MWTPFCYANYVVPELERFYSEQRQEIQAWMGLEDSIHPDSQPLLLQDNATVHTAAISQAALANAGIRMVPNFPTFLLLISISLKACGHS